MMLKSSKSLISSGMIGLALVLWLGIIGGADAGVTYSAAGDFSATKNPNGVWSYGQTATLAGAFELYTQSGPDNADQPPANLLDTWNAGTGGLLAIPAVFHNPTGGNVTFNGGTITYLPGELGFHPGPKGQYSVVRFTAPESATYSLFSAYRPIDVQATTDVHVLLNGLAIFNGLVNPGSPTSFDTTIVLTAGDRLDFAVGVGVNGNHGSDSTGLSATLTPNLVPEPSTLAGLGVGLVGAFLARGRWRGTKRGCGEFRQI